MGWSALSKTASQRLKEPTIFHISSGREEQMIKEKAFTIRLVDVWKSHFAIFKHSVKENGDKELTDKLLELRHRSQLLPNWMNGGEGWIEEFSVRER